MMTRSPTPLMPSFVLLLAGLMICAPAWAEDTTPPPAKPDEMVCEYRQITGSNMRQKICVSREQKEIEERLAREYMEETFKNGATSQKGN